MCQNRSGPGTRNEVATQCQLKDGTSSGLIKDIYTVTDSGSKNLI